MGSETAPPEGLKLWHCAVCGTYAKAGADQPLGMKGSCCKGGEFVVRLASEASALEVAQGRFKIP